VFIKDLILIQSLPNLPNILHLSLTQISVLPYKCQWATIWDHWFGSTGKVYGINNYSKLGQSL